MQLVSSPLSPPRTGPSYINCLPFNSCQFTPTSLALLLPATNIPGLVTLRTPFSFPPILLYSYTLFHVFRPLVQSSSPTHLVPLSPEHCLTFIQTPRFFSHVNLCYGNIHIAQTKFVHCRAEKRSIVFALAKCSMHFKNKTTVLRLSQGSSKGVLKFCATG